MEDAYLRTALYYDKIYAKIKDYAEEIRRLLGYLGEDEGAAHRSLLDVACGTGMHVLYLKEHFDVEGLDICEPLLQIARPRNPEIEFHLGDMLDFDLHKHFDIVTCLFSSIGYARTLEGLRAAVGCMVGHLKPGGILVIEPWFTPEQWLPNTVHADLVDEPELKIARLNTSFQEGRLSFFDLHHLIATPQGTEHVVEHHELGLFETEEVRSVMEDEGLSVRYDVEGLMGRGLFVGRLGDDVPLG